VSENGTHPVVTAELSKNGETVMVTFDYNPDFVKRVKKVPNSRFVSRDKPEGPGWRLNLDLPSMRKLREQFQKELVLGPKLTKWGKGKVEEEVNLTELSEANDAKLENVPARAIKGAKVNGKTIKLRPYQKADIKFMAATNVINANQPRTGKTIDTIGAMVEQELEWGQHLVMAPIQSLRNVWEDGILEFYKLCGFDTPTILTGDTPAQRRWAINEAKAMADEGYAFWLVVNPQAARMKRVKKEGTSGDNIEFEEKLVHDKLIEIDWDSITIDEFHLCGLSNPNTQTAKGINFVAEATQPTRKYALSGTPMGGKPIKLWGALHFLNPEEFTSRWGWARHWLVINSNAYGSSIEGIMPGREIDFYEHLKPYLVRRTQKEALPGLPAIQRQNIWCGMSDRQAAQYVKMMTEAEWIFEDLEEKGRLSAPNILALYTRLKQFANAYCDVAKTGKQTRAGYDELRVIPTQDSGKMDQLFEKLEEENVIVKGEDDGRTASSGDEHAHGYGHDTRSRRNSTHVGRDMGA
jgi:SNF2 family DNA or RNA helicase